MRVNKSQRHYHRKSHRANISCQSVSHSIGYLKCAVLACHTFHLLCYSITYCSTCLWKGKRYELVVHLQIIFHWKYLFLWTMHDINWSVVTKSKVHVSFVTFMLEDEHRLSLGMLMHVKCIHELCTLLAWLPTYLHLIYWYIHVLYWIMGILQWFPFIWDLTLRGRKPCFSCFWCFSTQTHSKRTHIRGILFFIREKQPGPKEHTRGGPRLQRAWSTRPQGGRVL